MKRSAFFSLLVILVLIPGTLYLGTQMTGRMYYLTSSLIIIEVMLPFFFSFENRRPQARELVSIAVMCALATAARVVVPIPSFKPMMAIIMMTGIAFGAEAGFMAGAITAFASNFFFTQGPWTPWQMMGYGIGGFVAGLVFRKRKFASRQTWKTTIQYAVFAFLCTLCVVGPLLDSCTIFTTAPTITKKYVLAVLASGLPYNINHALASGVTMLLFSKPMLEKLDRLKRKYGMMEAD